MDKEDPVENYGCPDLKNNRIIIQVCKDGSKLPLPAGVWVANNATYFCIASVKWKKIYAINIIYA